MLSWEVITLCISVKLPETTTLVLTQAHPTNLSKSCEYFIFMFLSYFMLFYPHLLDKIIEKDKTCSNLKVQVCFTDSAAFFWILVSINYFEFIIRAILIKLFWQPFSLRYLWMRLSSWECFFKAEILVLNVISQGNNYCVSARNTWQPFIKSW